MKIWFIAALLFLPVCAHAQVTFNVTGGSSTLYGATAAQVSMYAPSGISTASIGVYDGHFIFGGSEHTRFWGNDWYFGDRAISLTSGASGVAVPLLGAAIEHTSSDKHTKYTLFAGTIGPSFWLPYGSGIQPHNFGAGYSIERTMGGWNLSSIGLVAGNQKTFLEGLKYRRRFINLEATAGVLQNAFMVNGNASAFSRGFGINVGEQTLILSGVRADVTNESASYQFRALDFRATNVNGTSAGLRTAGQTEGMGLRLEGGTLYFRSDYYTARGTSATLVNTATEQLKHRWSVTEDVSTGGGRTTFNVGGGYVSNSFSASVTHSMLYYPALRSPWQNTLGVNVTFRLRDATVNLGTLATPTGGVKFVAYAGDYLYSQGATSTTTHSVGRYEIHGRVVDAMGKGVSGAALRVGNDMVYTDDDGTFSLRVTRTKPYVFTVLPAEFLSGNYRVTSAPQSVASGIAIEIVVKLN